MEVVEVFHWCKTSCLQAWVSLNVCGLWVSSPLTQLAWSFLVLKKKEYSFYFSMLCQRNPKRTVSTNIDFHCRFIPLHHIDTNHTFCCLQDSYVILGCGFDRNRKWLGFYKLHNSMTLCYDIPNYDVMLYSLNDVTYMETSVCQTALFYE